MLNKILSEEKRLSDELVNGIQEVWKHAMNKRGRLLVVEKNYTYTAQYAPNKEFIFPKDELSDHPFFIMDAVDDIIEKVVENGGDVEFVDQGLLENFHRIALIKYY